MLDPRGPRRHKLCLEMVQISWFWVAVTQIHLCVFACMCGGWRRIISSTALHVYNRAISWCDQMQSTMHEGETSRAKSPSGKACCWGPESLKTASPWVHIRQGIPNSTISNRGLTAVLARGFTVGGVNQIWNWHLFWLNHLFYFESPVKAGREVATWTWLNLSASSSGGRKRGNQRDQHYARTCTSMAFGESFIDWGIILEKP